MQIKKVELKNFRSYSSRVIDFSLHTVLLGLNGAGKSNALEAIYLLATGKSFRAERDSDMISYGAQFALISGETQDQALKVSITERKKFEVNGVPRRMQDFVGKLRAVLFIPADMELITGSPGSRRRYLDFVISQMDSEYRRCLISYEKGVRQRNKLLEKIRENEASHNQLFFWDRLLIKNGDYLTLKRGEYISQMSSSVYTIEYDKSIISEERLKQYEVEEVASATTLVGPHRDDFVVLDKSRDVARYGSRGEQRMAMLWLKTEEMRFLSQEDLPVLLLDDIFSELDHEHREEVLQVAAQHILAGGQVIMTSADAHLLPQVGDYKIIELKHD